MYKQLLLLILFFFPLLNVRAMEISSYSKKIKNSKINNLSLVKLEKKQLHKPQTVNPKFSLSEAALLSGKIIGLSSKIIVYKCADQAVNLGYHIINGMVVIPFKMGQWLIVEGLDSLEHMLSSD